jgi:hypothetical protein
LRKKKKWGRRTQFGDGMDENLGVVTYGTEIDIKGPIKNVADVAGCWRYLNLSLNLFYSYDIQRVPTMVGNNQDLLLIIKSNI